MKKLTTLIVIAAMVVLAMPIGCQSKIRAEETMFAHIVKTIHEQYVASLLASDSEAWLALWDDDGVLMLDNAVMAVGKESIKATMDGLFKEFKYVEFDIQISKTHIDGDFGFAFGNWNYTYALKTSGAKTYRYGKYVDIIKEQADGTWRIYLECYNTNKP